MDKNFKGKAIYNPSGKAGEYSYWACNFYVGCSNGCSYCYCKKGILAGAIGQDKPQLKKYFYDRFNALEVFQKEVDKNKAELQKHGLFFSFTTDPMLFETKELTIWAISYCIYKGIPVKILTKCTDWINSFFLSIQYGKFYPIETCIKYIAFGFTLTGHDELEKGASTNRERIEAMQKLHEAGFKTWASIEPIIDFETSYNMILATRDFCDLYKIGLSSGYKCTNVVEKERMIRLIDKAITHSGQNIYFKDSLLKAAGITRESLPSNCVSRDYNIFEN